MTNYLRKQKVLNMFKIASIMRSLKVSEPNPKSHKMVSQKANKRKWLNLRSDVVNKTLLRAVKRFYYSKFKILEKSMVRRRFKNVKTLHILDALAEFWEQQFQGLKFKVDYRLLAEFMMLFLGIKPKSTYRFDKSISYKAKLTLDCLRKYSYEKFKDLQKFKELRILIVKIYNQDLDELFSQVKTMEMNRERYIEAIDGLIQTS